MTFFKLPLKRSEKLIFENLAVLRWIFFQVRQFDFSFQSLLSFSALKTVHMCSNCKYRPLLEFIKGQLKLFMTLPLFVATKY